MFAGWFSLSLTAIMSAICISYSIDQSGMTARKLNTYSHNNRDQVMSFAFANSDINHFNFDNTDLVIQSKIKETSKLPLRDTFRFTSFYILNE